MKIIDRYIFPQITYKVQQSWNYFETWLNNEINDIDSPLQLKPDFQRGHVWTEQQQREYIEFVISGGSFWFRIIF